MKAIAKKQTIKLFVPITVSVTFESKDELDTFIDRMDACNDGNGGNYMSKDPTCKAIKNAIDNM